MCAGHDKQRRLGQELRPIREPRPTAEPGYHWCSTCKQFRPIEDFPFDRSRNAPKRVCLDCHSAAQQAYIERNREAVNLRRRLAKRGITIEQFNQLLAEQDGRCAVCGRERRLDIDHCHDTGAVRGLLCGPCNRALGFLDDNPALMRAAAEYIERRRAT